MNKDSWHWATSLDSSVAELTGDWVFNETVEFGHKVAIEAEIDLLVFSILDVFLFELEIAELHALLFFAIETKFKFLEFRVKEDSSDALEEINLILKIGVGLNFIFGFFSISISLIQQFLSQSLIELSQLFDGVE